MPVRIQPAYLSFQELSPACLRIVSNETEIILDNPQEFMVPSPLPEAPISSSAPPPSEGIFFGRFGLRSGWGIAIFVVLFLVFSSVISIATLAATGRLQKAIAQRKAQTTSQKTSAPAKPATQTLTLDDTLIGEGLGLVGVSLATWLLSLIERRRMAAYGIGSARRLDFFAGAFWGLAALSLLVGVLRAGHFLVFDARLLHGSDIPFYGFFWLLAFLFVGLLEEYLTRGYLQYTLTRGLFGLAEKISPTHARAVAFWIAAAIMSILFGAGHLGNKGETAWGICAVFLAGITFSYALWHTGSLWWAIGFHMAWDWAQSFLYGVPDSGGLSAGRLFQTHPTGTVLLSGGPDGPEGSLFVIPTLLLVVLIIRFTTRAGTQPPLEPIPAPHSLPPETHTLIP
jgi:membrane protease YdiL (CAAX protease family)